MATRVSRAHRANRTRRASGYISHGHTERRQILKHPKGGVSRRSWKQHVRIDQVERMEADGIIRTIADRLADYGFTVTWTPQEQLDTFRLKRFFSE